MQSPAICPTCKVRDFRSFGHRRYGRDAIERSRGWTKTALQILFERWMPDVAEAQFEFLACSNCGLMIYEPRPTTQDIAEKYSYVGGFG